MTAATAATAAAPGESAPMGPAQASPAPDDPKNAKEVKTELFSRFSNFDDPDTYESHMLRATGENTANFAVRFGVDKAEIAIDLNELDMGVLLQIQADQTQAQSNEDMITWINIWSPLANARIIKRIAQKYKFSTRLQTTIIGWDEARRQVKARHRRKRRDRGVLKTANAATADPEKGLDAEEVADKRAADAALALKLGQITDEDLDMYELLQEQYNYTTIDHGPNFICIGANWLHHRPQSHKSSHEVQDVYRDSADIVPNKHWAWYILTNEGTVISIHEAPHYDIPPRRGIDEQKWKTEELTNIRKNVRDLLHQLSRPGMEKYITRVSAQKGVRSDLSKPEPNYRGGLSHTRTTPLESSMTVDTSANLFFYLFEDYAAATRILSKSNDVLLKLTYDVLHITDRKNKDKDNSDIIRLLYARSKDLRQLKHLFESYEKLIKGIMDIGTDTGGEDRDSAALASSTGNLSLIGGGGGGPARGVKLSQRAYDRFDRLSTRMRLLMLNTIDEHLAEKASLGDTYFNLMSQNDSRATSRLNQSASLLAKLSVFFLPISFVTSYFSVQIPDLTDHYTGTTYWVAFAVTATLSFVSLFFFGRLLMLVSDALDEKVQNIQRAVTSGFRWALSLGSRQQGKHGHVEEEGEEDDMKGIYDY